MNKGIKVFQDVLDSPMIREIKCPIAESVEYQFHEREKFLPPNQKFRMTHQRKMILDEINKVHTHPTADEIYEIVRKKIPRISLGTVYRNLDVLVKNGLIQKIDPGQGHPQMRFDAKTEDHYHITCMGCGSLEDLPMNSPDDALDDLTKTLLKATEYHIAGHSLDFFGLCPLCNRKGESSFGEKMKELE